MVDDAVFEELPAWGVIMQFAKHTKRGDFEITRDGARWKIRHHDVRYGDVAIVSSPTGEVSYATASKLLTARLITRRLMK